VNERHESKLHGQEGWLFIALVFGRDEIFEALTKRIVPNIRVNERGELWTIDVVIPILGPMPLGIIGKLIVPTFISKILHSGCLG
jgi:hypothetical protein